MTRILCFGDSITIGYSDPDGGWPVKLNRYLSNIYINEYGQMKHMVSNLGVDADTSADVLARIKQETKTRISGDAIIILAIGVNDTEYDKKGHLVTEQDVFVRNMTEIIKIAHEFTEHVIVLGLLPCDESRMQPMPWSKTGASYSNKNIKLYDKLLSDVARDQNVYFADIFDDFSKLDTDLYLQDGSHPTPAGHQYIADKIKKKVAEMANDYK